MEPTCQPHMFFTSIFLSPTAYLELIWIALKYIYLVSWRADPTEHDIDARIACVAAWGSAVYVLKKSILLLCIEGASSWSSIIQTERDSRRCQLPPFESVFSSRVKTIRDHAICFVCEVFLVPLYIVIVLFLIINICLHKNLFSYILVSRYIYIEISISDWREYFFLELYTYLYVHTQEKTVGWAHLKNLHYLTCANFFQINNMNS
jgi:hypothetical protein